MPLTGRSKRSRFHRPDEVPPERQKIKLTPYHAGRHPAAADSGGGDAELGARGADRRTSPCTSSCKSGGSGTHCPRCRAINHRLDASRGACLVALEPYAWADTAVDAADALHAPVLHHSSHPPATLRRAGDQTRHRCRCARRLPGRHSCFGWDCGCSGDGFRGSDCNSGAGCISHVPLASSLPQPLRTNTHTCTHARTHTQTPPSRPREAIDATHTRLSNVCLLSCFPNRAQGCRCCRSCSRS